MEKKKKTKKKKTKEPNSTKVKIIRTLDGYRLQIDFKVDDVQDWFYE